MSDEPFVTHRSLLFTVAFEQQQEVYIAALVGIAAGVGAVQDQTPVTLAVQLLQSTV